MKLHLPDLKVVVFTCGVHTFRRAKICRMFAVRGFRNYQFVFGLEGGTVEDYWKNLIPGMLKVYRETRPPFLFLQDDVVETSFYQNDVNVPDDAQVAFLGGSDFEFRYDDRPDEWVRLHSMMCDHSVIYLDRAAQETFATSIEQHLDTPYDVSIALMFNRLRVYCLKQPYYRQCDGHNDVHTQNYYPGQCKRSMHYKLFEQREKDAG